MKRRREKGIVAGLFLAFAVLIFVQLLLLLSASHQRKAAARNLYSRDVFEKLNELVTFLSEAETGRRGYVLSGQERYLGHHTNRAGQVHEALTGLRRLAVGDPRYAPLIRELEPMVFKRLTIFTNSLRARQTNGVNLPEQIAFMEEGQAAMDPIRQLAYQTVRDGTARLRAQREAQRESAQGAVGFALLASLFSVGLFGLMAALLVRSNRRRHEAEEGLRQTNLALEQRVEERTAELSQSVEKVRWLASFPENNPNPVIEIDLTKRAIHYANPYCVRLFPTLLQEGLDHPFLAAVRDVALTPMKSPEPIRQDVVVGELCYSQTILYSPENQRLRVYSTEITERIRAEKNARWLSLFPEQNPNPIIELDLASGVIHYANPFTQQLFPDLLVLRLQHPFLAGLSESARELQEGATDAVRREVMLGERCYAQTISLVKETGRLRIYSSDISERKQAEASLELQRSELQLILDTVPALIFYKDTQHRLLRVNQEMVRLMGLPKESIEGKTDQDLGTPYADRYLQDEIEILASGQPRRGIIEPMVSPIGLRWLQTDKVPFRDKSGHVAGIIGLAVDITERRRSEEKLREQLVWLNLLDKITRAIGERQNLASIFATVLRALEEQQPSDLSCLCLYDPTAHALTVASVGPRSQALAQELQLSDQAQFPVDENGLSRCVRGQLVYEPKVQSVPFPFPQRLARVGLRSVVIAPLMVESQVFGLYLTARRTEAAFSSNECEFLRQLCGHVALAAHQAQLYTALEKAYFELRQSQQAVMQQERLKALGQMASGIAHDINNAISPVTLYTESLLANEPGLSARARDYLQTIRQAVQDVAATVARMREFYRQREPQLVLVPVQLNQLVQQVVDLTRARWNDMPLQRGTVIRMVTELFSDLPAILGVESEIREALTNVIFNAVDAMPEGGTLTLRTRVLEPAARLASGERSVTVEISDTGIGMDDDTRRRCLEPFFTTKGERGTGLGLAMVYGMAQRHGAEMEIESSVGRGTTVRFTFAAPAAAVPGQPAPNRPTSIPSRLRVLVVDDDPLLIKSLRDTLETDGHLVVTANGGKEGIATFQRSVEGKQPFDVVITDLGMPYVDGRKVASEIKMLSSTTPVVLLTGWGQRLVAEGDIPPHVDRVLNKPPRLSDLREAMAQLHEEVNP